MNNDAATIQWEDRFTDDEREIANMDEFDFMTLLMARMERLARASRARSRKLWIRPTSTSRYWA